MSGTPKPSVRQYLADKAADALSLDDEADAALGDSGASIDDEALQALAPAAPPRVTTVPVTDIVGVVPGSGADPNRDGVGAFMRSGAQGLTARFGDEVSSGLASAATATTNNPLIRLLEQFTGTKTPEQIEAASIPREYAHGSAYADMRDNMRADLATDKAAYKAAPWYQDPSVTGELAGGALSALATGGAGASAEAARAATLGARAAQAAKVGAAYGGAAGLGGSESDSVLGNATDAAVGAGTGALVGPAAEAVPAGLGMVASGARAAANKMAPLADKLNFTATGIYPQQLTALLKEKGPEYIQQLGQYARGLKGEHPLAFLKPWGAKSYQEAADNAASEAGARIGASLSAADEAGVRVATDPIADAMESYAQSYGGPLGTNPADKQGGALMSEAARWRTQQPDSMSMGNAGIDPTTLAPRFEAPAPARTVSPSDAMAMKKEYERLGGYVGDRITTLPHGSTPEMYQDAANPVRGAVYDAMDTAPGDIGPQFRADMSDYGKANTILNAANKRVMHDDANHIISLPSAVLASGGLATGHPAGLAAGAGMGLVKGYGKDVGASLARLAQLGAGGISNAADAAATAAQPVAIAEAQRAGAPERSMIASGASGAFDMTGFGASPAYSNDNQDQLNRSNTQALTNAARQISGKTRGGDLGSAVQQTLKTDPASLGPYQQQLAEAADDPQRMANILAQLGQDPEFRPIYHRLSAMTAAQ